MIMVPAETRRDLNLNATIDRSVDRIVWMQTPERVGNGFYVVDYPVFLGNHPAKVAR